jgi:hypothetical protein
MKPKISIRRAFAEHLRHLGPLLIRDDVLRFSGHEGFWPRRPFAFELRRWKCAARAQRLAPMKRTWLDGQRMFWALKIMHGPRTAVHADL